MERFGVTLVGVNAENGRKRPNGPTLALVVWLLRRGLHAPTLGIASAAVEIVGFPPLRVEREPAPERGEGRRGGIWGGSNGGVRARRFSAVAGVSAARGGEGGILRDRRTEVAGLRWHARVAVDAAPVGAPPVVLVHGLGVSSKYFEPTAKRLARHHPTYAPDLPGFGGSEGPSRAFGITGLAEALVGWLDANDLASVVLLGNSVGCQIVVEIAVRHPARVSRLILTGPTGDPTRSLGGATLRLLIDIPRESFRMVAVVAVDYLRAGPRRLVETARSMSVDPFAAKLPLVRQPTLVVRGDRDPIAPQRWVEQVGRALPDGRLVVVRGATHVVNYSAPDALVAATRAFLAERRAEERVGTTGG